MRKILLIALLASTAAFAADAPKLGLQIETNDTGKAGVLVLDVAPGSPAERAGMATGDIIATVDGKPTPNIVVFKAALHPGALRFRIVHPVVAPTDVTVMLGGSAAPAMAQRTPSIETRGGSAGPMIPPRPPLQHWPIATIRWVQYRDPNEGAFTIAVPQGWQVSGGAYSVSAVETRVQVEVRSPDGAVTLFYGDKDIPSFAIPNQMLAMGGLREGMWYDVGYNQRLLVHHYEPGAVFAAEWGQTRIARACPGARVVSARPLPQATQAMDYAYSQGGVRTSLQAGEAQFSCGSGVGYVFAATEQTVTTGNGIWDVKHLVGFTAPPSRAADAAGLLAQFAVSFRPDPDWLARHNQVAMTVSHIVAETGEAMSRAISSSYWNKAASEQHNSQVRGEATLGIHTYHDPVTGNDYPLDSSHAHWFIDHNGNRIPSDTGTPPCPGCRELEQVRH